MADPARPLLAQVARLLALVAALSLLAGSSLANQGLVVRDGTLGSGALDVAAGTDPLGQPADYLISEDLGEQHGANLFHSFASFGVGAGETATFTGPQSVANIISRVTGGSASDIDGTLRSTIAGADLWLINPSGLVFGSGAQLDVPGSFHAATADSLGFDDAGLARFYADLGKTSVLSVADPRAFGFLGSAPTGAPSLRLDGSALTVPAGETLSLVAGDGLALNGAHLTAENGRINLAAVASPGDVVLAPASAADPLDVSSFAALGEVSLAQASVVDAGGTAPGSVFIRGGRVVVGGSQVLVRNDGGSAGGLIDISASASLDVDDGMLSASSFLGAPGTLEIRTGSMSVLNGGVVESGCWGCTSHKAARSADAGTIRIEAADLFINTNGARRSMLLAGTVGDGDAGRLDLTLSGSLELTRTGMLWAGTNANGAGGEILVRAGSILVTDPTSGIFATALGTLGPAGTISINAGSLKVSAGGQINTVTYSSGNAGAISIDADSLELSGQGTINATTLGSGNAGAITVDADSIFIASGGGIAASSGNGGYAGRIDVRASQSILLDHEDGDAFSLIGLVSGTGSPSTGIYAGTVNGLGRGRVSLDAPDITITNGARVGVATIGGGDAGDAFLHAERIHIVDGGAVISSSFVNPINGQPGGAAGSVTLVADESIEVVGTHPLYEGVSRVSSETQGAGAPGSVSLQAPRILVDGGAVATTALQFLDVPVDANAGSSAGGIRIEGRDVNVRGGGRIDASSFVARDGGDILIDASESITIEGAGSEISARSGSNPDDVRSIFFAPLFNDGLVGSPTVTGNSGSILLRANDVLITDGAITTSADFADGGNIEMLARGRVELTRGAIETKVVGGRGGNITIGSFAIAPESVHLLDASKLDASAGHGNGGDIRITTRDFYASVDSTINATGGFGVNGVIDIQSPDTDLLGALATLPTEFLDVTLLQRERCAARRAGLRTGSFTVRGASGVPAEPDASLLADALAYAAPTSGLATRDGIAFASQLAATGLTFRPSCD